jgi:uncharacterized protein involved in exopolysaccharide biosynthesis
MAEESSRRKTPRDRLRILFRRRGLFLLGAAVFAVAALLMADTLPLKYTGTTRFQRVTRPDSQQKGSSERAFEVYKLKLIHDIKGRRAVEEAAEELGLLKDLPHNPDGTLTREGVVARQNRIAALQEQITVSFEVKSANLDLVTVSVTSGRPDLARKLPDLLVKSYLRQIQEEIFSAVKMEYDTLSEKVRTLKDSAAEIRNQRIEFEKKHAGAFVDDPDALNMRIRGTESQLEELYRERAMAQLQLRLLKSMPVEGNSPTTMPIQEEWVMNPEIARLEEELRGKEELLRQSIEVEGMKKKHPTVVRLEGEIEYLRKRLEEEPEKVLAREVIERMPGDALGQWEKKVEQTALEAKLDGIESRIRNLHDTQKRLNESWTRFATYHQEYVQLVEQEKQELRELDRYRELLARSEFDLQAETQNRQTRLEAVEWAQEQFKPSSPKLMFVLGGSLAAGLAFGGGLVFLAGMLDRSVTTTEEALEDFKLPVHGVISEIRSRRDRIRRLAKRYVLWPLATILMVGLLGVAAFNIVLRLNFPREYIFWRADPVDFVVEHASGILDRGPKTSITPASQER